MKFLIPVVLVVFAISSIGIVYSFSIEHEFTGHWYVSEDGVEQAWLFNPNNLKITSSNPEREFTIEHVGNWDVISHEDSFNTREYFVGEHQADIKPGDWLPPLVWLDGEIVSMQEQIDHLESELITQIQRTITLEQKLTELQMEIVELKNKPSE